MINACHINTLMDESINFAKSINKQRKNYVAMKARMNAEIIRIIDEEDPKIIESGKFTT